MVLSFESVAKGKVMVEHWVKQIVAGTTGRKRRINRLVKKEVEFFFQ